jgi:hypothetical protein
MVTGNITDTVGDGVAAVRSGVVDPQADARSMASEVRTGSTPRRNMSPSLFGG